MTVLHYLKKVANDFVEKAFTAPELPMSEEDNERYDNIFFASYYPFF